MPKLFYSSKLLCINYQLYISKDSACLKAYYHMPFLNNITVITNAKVHKDQLCTWILILERERIPKISSALEYMDVIYKNVYLHTLRRMLLISYELK